MYRETILHQALQPTNYDYVLLDCPPALGVLTTNSLYVADFIKIFFLSVSFSVYQCLIFFNIF